MTPATRVVLATRNEHKVHELRQILADLVDELGLEIVGAAEVDGPDVPGDRGDLRGERAAQGGGARRGHRSAGARRRLGPGGRRPRRLARRLQRAVVRDDRRHGPAARGPDRANLRLLLDQVADVAGRAPGGGVRLCGGPRPARTDGRSRRRAEVRGTLAREPRGDNGFGYDPIFRASSDGDPRTLAEYSDEEKNAISHRGRAFREMAPILRKRLTE